MYVNKFFMEVLHVNQESQARPTEWWRRSTVYQVYPKSFKDTTGSGTGDIRGLTEKLDYLQELGIDIVWLQPVYVSPGHDNGYDVADYERINPEFGTMEDFDELVAELHRREMKLMTDIVVNHTSTEHEWFKQAISSRDNHYRNYYIWKDPAPGGEYQTIGSRSSGVPPGNSTRRQANITLLCSTRHRRI